jgi:hypothetical protein
MRNLSYNLRIAFTAACGVGCLLLIFLWLRSYWWRDLAYLRLAGIHFQVGSADGRSKVVIQDLRNSPPSNSFGSATLAFDENEDQLPWNPSPTGHSVSAYFGYYHTTGLGLLSPYASLTQLVTPHWFLALMAGTLAAFPWLQWSKQFTIRALLIATAIVAVWVELIRYTSN